MTELEKRIRSLHRAGESFVLASVVGGSGSMPRHRGARMVVCRDSGIAGSVGGGELEAQTIARALRVFASQQDETFSFVLNSREVARSEMICGGSGEISLQYFPPARDIRPLLEASGTLYLFGGGHISRALAQGAALLELPTVVLDDRAEFANRARFSQSDCIVLESFAAIPPLAVGQRDMLVIVTRGHLGDADALRWAVRQDAGYIGMIGSRHKRDLTYEQLIQEGVPQERLEQVHSPIGLAIGAETPGEIAVSILAELVKVRSEWDREEKA